MSDSVDRMKELISKAIEHGDDRAKATAILTELILLAVDNLFTDLDRIATANEGLVKEISHLVKEADTMTRIMRNQR